MGHKAGATTGYADFVLYRRLARLTLSSWPSIFGLFVAGLIAIPLALLTPLPLKIAVDSVIGARPLPRLFEVFVPSAARTPMGVLVFATALTVLIALLTQLQALASKYLTAVAAERLVLEFRSRVFRQLQQLSLSYHDSLGPADSLYRIQNDAQSIRSLVIDGFIPSVGATATLVSMIYVMMRMDWRLTLVALAISPPIVLATQAYRPRLRRQSRDVRKLESAALAVVHEVLGALRVVKAFTQEEHESGRFLKRSNDGVRGRIRLALAEGYYGLIVGLATAVGTAAVLFVGIAHVQAGVISLGSLLLMMGYLAKLYDPVKTISRKMATVQGHLASVERAFAILDAPCDVEERPGAQSLARARGHIAFKNVSFGYGPDRSVLHAVSFEVEPGTRLGIVGPSGAGKSTLTNLLMRFYDPSDGCILLDGIDLRDYRLEDLRRQFAIVLQDTVLFSTTIADNIAYGKQGAPRDAIVAAAQVANAHDFIARLPRGYDTEVGERGVQLSGGQRQRIALARAFLQDSPVLILDEPTSAVDTESEAAILRALRRLMRGRTVLVITHRTSMLEGCNALLAVENGRVVTDVPAAASGKPARAPAIVPQRAANVMAHPAAQAWIRLHPNEEPLQVIPLRISRKNRIYRIEVAARSPVIAKRSSRAGALIERSVYERILPHAVAPSAGYHGFFEEPDGEHCWIFMEEVIGDTYLRLLAGHREEAARWLGRLHLSVADMSVNGSLPDGGPRRFLKVLQSNATCMVQHLDNPVLTPDDIATLERHHSRLCEVAAQWDRLEEVCDGAPRTLVHGDFNGKNLRVRPENGHSKVVVFDWEEAGWGVPAVDLAQHPVRFGSFSRLSASPDISTYWSTIRDRWPSGSPERTQQLAHCGSAFRALVGLSWDVSNLSDEWAHACLGDLQLYMTELDDSLERLGWSRQ
jgi:ATP-binding cassette, subfamily B, bacterial